MSTAGRRTEKPATSRSNEMSASKSRMSATSALVPPMSRVMTLRRPEPFAECAAPTAPAAGPDNAVRTGSARARSGDIRPPLDWLIPMEASGATRASPSSRSDT